MWLGIFDVLILIQLCNSPSPSHSPEQCVLRPYSGPWHPQARQLRLVTRTLWRQTQTRSRGGRLVWTMTNLLLCSSLSASNHLLLHVLLFRQKIKSGFSSTEHRAQSSSPGDQKYFELISVNLCYEFLTNGSGTREGSHEIRRKVLQKDLFVCNSTCSTFNSEIREQRWKIKMY